MSSAGAFKPGAAAPFMGAMGNVRPRLLRRPTVVSMCFAVERMAAVRDKLNPIAATARQVDLNLNELRDWRNGLHRSRVVAGTPEYSALCDEQAQHHAEFHARLARRGSK